MARDIKQVDHLYEEIKRDEVCHYRNNAIYRRHDKRKGFMYSVNNSSLFELFSEAMDHIDRLEDGNGHL